MIVYYVKAIRLLDYYSKSWQLTLISILVEASKGIDLVIAHVGHRGIDQAGRLGTDCGDDLGLVAFGGRLAVADGAGSHQEGVVG